MKLVNTVDDNGLSSRRIRGLVAKRWAFGCAWITRYAERPKLFKVPGPRHWRRLCIFFYRFGIGYRIGQFK